MHKSIFLHAVHAFVRFPNYRSVPSSGPNGALINRDMLINQFRDFYRTLQHSNLFDKVHLMSERPLFDSVRVSDQLISVGSTLLGMPFVGIEHRTTEFMETMRYIRHAGGQTTAGPYLQDAENCRCHAGDIISLPNGLAIGNGSRTNSVAFDILRQLFEINDPSAPFDVLNLEQESDAPPLGDYIGFAGDNIILAWKDEHGMLAVDQLLSQLQEVHEKHLSNSQEALSDSSSREFKPPQVVFIEPGCHFLSFYTIDFCSDVLIQRGYERSIEQLVSVGLNPLPVNWSEMDKMSVSMRSAVLPLKFLQSSVVGMLSRTRTKTKQRWQNLQLPSG